MSDTASRPGRSSGAAAWSTWIRLLDLRSIAIVFYLCLTLALSRAFGWLADAESWAEWGFTLARYTRQTLITGALMLLAVAAAETWLAWRGEPRARAAGLAVRALAVGCAAFGGTWLRFELANLGDPAASMPRGWMWSTALLWSLLGAIAYALVLAARAEQRAQAALLEARAARAALQSQQIEAQLSALNAQIEPHFLFNTLATVKRLYETSPDRGRDMLTRLIDYLRAALPGMRRSVSTLGQELDLVRSYLGILQMRMGTRLRFTIAADPALLPARLPPMVLPTLVENAIKHGLAPLPDGGRIEIRARAVADAIVIEVEDDGRGFVAGGGSGVGLANTRARLVALFGGRAALELEAATPRGVIARVRLPRAEALADGPAGAAATPASGKPGPAAGPPAIEATPA
ncbi:MAG TPA: histidine kinase [Rubrivivax sp.]|nr:histidine kinase [Rubrivivax sp.]